MPFLVIPALDLKDGKCVQLTQGDPKKVIISLDDPLDIALEWQEMGAPRLHVVDLDGAIGGVRKNQPLVEEIIYELDIPIQLGGGIRSIDDAQVFLDLGTERVILGTLAMERPSTVEKLAEKYGRDRITVALDEKDGRVVVRGWNEKTNIRAAEAVKSFETNASEVLFTNVDVEGLLEGIREEPIREMVASTSLGVIVAGGITTLSDLDRIKRAGALGAVVGAALYTGKIDYKKALRL